MLNELEMEESNAAVLAFLCDAASWEDWEFLAGQSYPPVPVEVAHYANIRPLIALAAMPAASWSIH